MFWAKRRPQKTAAAVQRSREGWFQRIGSLFRTPQIREELWQELEELLIAADVGMATTARLLEKVRARVKRDGLREPPQVEDALKGEMVAILSLPVPAVAVPSPPEVVLVIGVNGVGKTTSIAKLAHLYREQGKGVILAAADTFRAAGIEQLQIWGERAGVEVIAHQAGADPGAVVFDAIQAAKRRGRDVVIIDTAGRLHTKYNLMEELKKVKRVIAKADPAAPHQTLLIMDATTGQNGLAQAQAFTQALGVNSLFLAKLDGTARGGITLAICDQLRIPILFIGTGEGLEDIAPFDPEEFVAALFAPS